MRNACHDEIYKLAKSNKKVIFIGSDLGAGVQENLKKEELIKISEELNSK